MKFLGVAVAFLVLAVSLEYANAGQSCRTNYTLLNGICYRTFSHLETFSDAVKICLNDSAKLLNTKKYGGIPGLDEWINIKPPTGPGDCQITGPNNLTWTVTCNTTAKFTCIIEPACNCTVKDDPLVLTGDGAVISLVGEGMYRLIEYETQTTVCQFDVMIDTSGPDPKSFVVDEVKIIISDGTIITVNSNGISIEPDGTFIPHDPTVIDILFSRPPVFDMSGITPGYQIRQDENGHIIFEVDDCYQTMDITPQGGRFDVTVTLEPEDHGPMTGLCGSFDGDADNDLMTADGDDVNGQSDRNILISDSYRVVVP